MDRPAKVLPLILAACAVLFYWQVLSYGLWFDDYMDLRPWGRADAWRVFTGAWSVNGWQDPYHRPLSSLLTFGLFEVFGMNTRALHAVSLAGLALIVVALFEAMRRLVGRGWATVVVLTYLLHPVLPNSTMAWVGNLKHVAAVVTVVCALWWWSRRAALVCTWRAWWPIAACAVVGFYFKEDTVMVLPALLAVQWIWANRTATVPAPTRGLVFGAVLVFAALAGIRLAVLPEAAGSTDLLMERPFEEALTTALYTPARALFVIRYDGDIMWWASAFVSLLVAAGGLGARRAGSVAERLWILGACLGAAFSLPLLFAMDMTTMRAHLVTLSAALVWAGGIAALWEAATPRRLQSAVVVVVMLGALRLGFISQRQLDERFGPCGWETGVFDQDVSAWPEYVIPADTKTWLARKAPICEAEGTPYLWDEIDAIRWRTDDGVVVLISERLTRVRIDVSAGAGDAWLMGPQGVITHLPDGVGGGVDVDLPPSWRSWLRDAHRLNLRGSAQRALTVTALR